MIEDEPDVRELAEQLLSGEGHLVMTAPDGYAALDLVGNGKFDPQLVLADYNLPKGLNGLQVAAMLREKLRHEVPVIIMTGDISASTMRDIHGQNCMQLNKPVKMKEMMEAIERLLAARRVPSAQGVSSPEARIVNPASDIIYVVDDDASVCDGFRVLLEASGYSVETYSSSEVFLESYKSRRSGCLLIDAYLPGMSGLDLLQRLRESGDTLPAIMITGNSDVPMAVKAMKIGAADFIEKPVSGPELLASVAEALDQSRNAGKIAAWRENAARHIAGLTLRQRQVMELVLVGQPSKNIAADLGISQRTVENHRAFIMKKTGAKSLPALARLALAAGANVTD